MFLTIFFINIIISILIMIDYIKEVFLDQTIITLENIYTKKELTIDIIEDKKRKNFSFSLFFTYT